MIFQSGLIFERDAERPSCHASTIIEIRDEGKYMAAWFAGSRESAPDVAIVAMNFDGKTWNNRRILAKVEGKSHYNPVLWLDSRSGRIWLFYCTGLGCDKSLIRARVSDDGGKSFSDDIHFLPDHVGWLTKNKPIELKSGRWLLPIYDELTWESMMAMSDDRGGTWRMSGRMSGVGRLMGREVKEVVSKLAGKKVGPLGNIQPTLIQRDDGAVFALLRCMWGYGHLLSSVSFDDGESWSSVSETGLPNPGSGIDAVRLLDGSVVLIYNPLSEGRHIISAAISNDQGLTWPHSRDLESPEKRVPKTQMAGKLPFYPLPKENYEYSYPAVIQAHDGSVVTTYTYKRESVKWVRFDPGWISRKSD